MNFELCGHGELLMCTRYLISKNLPVFGATLVIALRRLFILDTLFSVLLDRYWVLGTG